MRIVLGMILLLTAAAVSAQVQQVTLIPPSPTTQDFVMLRISTLALCSEPAFTRAGNYIRVEVPNTCLLITPPISTFDLTIGYLPSGNYTYEVFESAIATTPEASGSFTVVSAGSPFVPTLSAAALIMACALLGVAGWFAVGRHG
jgi:hypothetical protein